MEQYISKAALVAEIEKRRKEWWFGSSIEAKYKKEECDDILSFLDTLEVKEAKEESVSEDSKKHISLVTERMLKEGPIPTLRGKEKADFENEFNRFKQITGMINWPSREEIYKNVILWFIAWSRDHLKIGDIVDKSEMDKQPVSEDLEEAVNAYIGYAPEVDESSSTYGKRQAFKAGAEWQKNHLWKPADGDDLPEIDMEVIALLDNGKVVFAHRPNPEGWDAVSIITENVEHYIPETYGKGGWNIPNVVLWLDAKLPKEIEL